MPLHNSARGPLRPGAGRRRADRQTDPLPNDGRRWGRATRAGPSRARGLGSPSTTSSNLSIRSRFSVSTNRELVKRRTEQWRFEDLSPAEVSGGTEDLRALLLGYAGALETICGAPPVLWAGLERPRILRWLRFPAPRALVSTLLVRHVSRCISSRQHRRPAVSRRGNPIALARV
jgi:hypothetical protein